MPPLPAPAHDACVAPPVVTVLRPDARAELVLVCEHASNHIPPEYGRLGLEPAELERHIAYDIGAAGLAQLLADHLDAVAFLSGRSRLLVDGNRPPGSPGSIPELSEATPIPGNRGLGEREVQRRLDRHFRPFHEALRVHLDARHAAGRPTRIFGVHTFAPVFLGAARDFEVGVLFRGAASAWGAALVAALARAGRSVRANEPYAIDDDSDYLIPMHAEPRGLEAVLVEVRQDLVGTATGQQAWAATLAAALQLTARAAAA